LLDEGEPHQTIRVVGIPRHSTCRTSFRQLKPAHDKRQACGLAAGWTGLFVRFVILRTAALRPWHMVGLRGWGGERFQVMRRILLAGGFFLDDAAGVE
jgi:hypothetical protein